MGDNGLSDFHPSLQLVQFKLWLQQKLEHPPVEEYDILELMVYAFDVGVAEGRKEIAD